MLDRLAIRPMLLLLGLISLGFQYYSFRHSSRPHPKDDSVVRIRTELVQTDVMIFDKQGHFVDGLRPEDFALTLDGKQQNIQFFERIAAGSAREEINYQPPDRQRLRG